MARYMTRVLMAAGVHYIIDVNYFPSYKEFPDVTGALAAVIQSVYKARQSQTNFEKPHAHQNIQHNP